MAWSRRGDSGRRRRNAVAAMASPRWRRDNVKSDSHTGRCPASRGEAAWTACGTARGSPLMFYSRIYRYWFLTP